VVEAAHDGESGLQRATGGGYLLVVLDVMLPGINGFEVLRRIRATSRCPCCCSRRAAKMWTELWVWRLAPTIICQNHLTREN